MSKSKSRSNLIRRATASGLPLGEFAVNNFELFAQLTILLLQLLDTLPERRNNHGLGIVGRARLTCSERRQCVPRPQLLNPGLERRLLIEPGPPVCQYQLRHLYPIN
jgi:hypothetical protein